MNRLSADQITPKNCSKCGAAFGCGISSAAGCWCADLPQVGPVGASDLDCLCPTCLSEAIVQAPSKESSATKPQIRQSPAPLIENEDYYLEGAAMVFTAQFLLRRGYCCESGCRHCPYLFLPPSAG